VIASNPLATSCRHRPVSPHVSSVHASPSSQPMSLPGVQDAVPGRVLVVVLPGCVTVVVVVPPTGVVVVVVPPTGFVVVVVALPPGVVVVVVALAPGVVVVVVALPPGFVVVVVPPPTGVVVVVVVPPGVVVVVVPLGAMVVVVVPVFCGALMMPRIASPKSESRMLASTPREVWMSSRYRS
jgi:hypothetical protein